MYLNFLTALKNASIAKKTTLKTDYSKMVSDIAEVLKHLGFIKKIEVKGRAFKKIIEIELNPERPITGLKFLSKPSRRLYSSYRSIKNPKGGLGSLVITTSKGIMSARKAREQKVGGQLLFEIW